MESVLVQDPNHAYAAHLIHLIYRRHGLRSVVTFANRRERGQAVRAYPALRSEAIEAAYDVDPSQLRSFAEHVRNHHRVVGVVPFAEPTVLPSAKLAEWLGLQWNPLETMRRFRDKYAFKEHLRSRHPHIRVNASHLVTTIDDVLPGGKPRFARYVLKPNEGWGNRDVAVFDESIPPAVVSAFLRSACRPVVCEEYVGGDEYFVNGQVDAHGEIAVVAVFKYARVPANGRSNIDHETRRLRRADPTFAVLEKYTREVVRASGLRRSPFHAEVKIDASGPCLIEIGARLPGNSNAWVCNALHGGQFDIFEAAAHFYVRQDDYGPLGLDWDHYDRTEAVYVHGVESRRERIHTVEGVDQVERLPSFAGWIKKPRIGEWMTPTVSSMTSPWCVLLMSKATGHRNGAATPVGLGDVQAVRALRINPGPSPLRSVAATFRAMRTRVKVELGCKKALVEDWNRRSREPMKKRALALTGDAIDTLVRPLQLRGFLPARRARASADVLTPARVAQSGAMLRWVREYIAEPHPQLGRSGAICPFVQRSMDLDRLVLTFHEEVDGSSIAALRAVVLGEARRLKARFPADQPDNGFGSILAIFPNIADDRLAVLDQVHREAKTHLMKADVMAAVFHARSDKPAVNNPEFSLYRAPIPCIAFRHLEVRDITFLGTNAPAFARYRERFEARYSKGLVSNHFGYVDRFEEAKGRFGECPVDAHRRKP